MAPRDGDNWFEDDELVREEGVLISKSGGHEVHAADKDAAPDDWLEGGVREDNVPGTVDDIPYDYGVEVSHAADETLEGLERGSE